MTHSPDKSRRSIDPRIRKELLIGARRLRENRIMRANARRWFIASGVALAILAARIFWPSLSSLSFLLVCGVIVVTLFANFVGKLKTPLNYREAVRRVEAKFPDLENMLTTAMEQKRSGEGYNFLQEKVIKEALHFSLFQYWEDVGKRSRIPAQAIHMGALLLILCISGLTYYAKDQTLSIKTPILPVLISSVEVTPGDTDVERGSALVIAARFRGEVPRSTTLVLKQDDGQVKNHAMAQSLSDPIFAYTLPNVDESAHYFIEFSGKETETFRLNVFDLPALLQANAFLDFPDYTGIRDRLIEDTRRVSAVEGTRLSYEFLVNKPLASAELVDKQGKRIALTPANPEKTRFSTDFELSEDLRYHLHLRDEEGRQNAYPPDVRIVVRENKKPELRLNFPKGDQAVSPIEELTLEAKANDDFGLIDYGLAIAIGAENPDYISLKESDPGRLEAEFDKLYALEEESVEVDQLVTWFAWADDYGVDGEARRSTSDLFFAEVRPLEEIYREGEGGGGQGQGQGGGPEGELLEQQRQIAIATFKLKQRGRKDSSFLEDTGVLRDSQQQIRLQLEQVKMELQEEKLLQAANLAGEFMDKAVEAFEDAYEEETEQALEPAWLAAQGAYQALLSMRPREMNVNQSRSQAGGGGGQNRNQRQLNQLDFNEDENRYETESQAQAMTTPEEREQLEVLSKLSELARRQQQVNERLSELQTALAAAENQEERDKIRRELKRLQEEQRRMLTQMDEVQQRMDNLPQNQEMREAGEQLQEAREDMRNISESLQEEEVSQALAAGSRAQQNLEELKDEFRESTSSQFSEAMRQVRDAARELAETQRELSEELEQLQSSQTPRLDGSGNREGVADRYRQQQENLENLLNDLRQITEDSETGEPTLHRKLYDVLRRQNQNDTDENLSIAEELVRRGFLDQAQDMQPGLQESLNELERAVSEAAESVMGDEATALRFAQEELDDLINQLEEERPEGELAENQGSQEGASQPGGKPGEEPRQGTPGQSEASGQEPGTIPSQSEDGQLARSEAQQPGNTPGEQQAGQAGQQPGQQGEGQQAGGSQQPGSRQQGSSLAQNGQQPGPSESPGGQPSQGSAQGGRQTSTGGGGGGGGNPLQNLNDIIRSFTENSGGWDGPITGDGFVEWNERLRTIEELMELPGARERMQQAREQAERMRAEFKRHGNPPQWGDIDTSVLQPIREVESWVQQELLRKENPDTLQPIDRDPIPPKFANSVKKYYEALGGDS